MSLDFPPNLALSSYHLPQARGVLQTLAGRGEGVAPAGGARNPALGRPRVAVRPHYGGLPSMAGRGADEGGRKPAGSGAQEGPVRARKHSPGDINRRAWSAGRRLSGIATGEDTPSQGVSGGFASRSGGLANLRVSRRSIPSALARRRKREGRRPRAVNNRGDESRLNRRGCLKIESETAPRCGAAFSLLIPPPQGEGGPAERIAKPGRVGFGQR